MSLLRRHRGRLATPPSVRTRALGINPGGGGRSDARGGRRGDIDAVVLGKAPDLLRAWRCPSIILASASVVGKPLLRVHTAGSVGGSTAVVGAILYSPVFMSGSCAACSRSRAARTPCGRCRRPIFSAADGGGAWLFCAADSRLYSPCEGAHDVGWKVVIKDRRNALKNLRSICTASRRSSSAQAPVLWDPINYLETVRLDGACAMVLSSESAAKRAPQKPALFKAHRRSEPIFFPGRDQVSLQAGRTGSRCLRTGSDPQPTR